MTEGSTLQQSSSMMEPEFDDDEIFFGPITDKEKIVKEMFEKRMHERGILLPKLSNIGIDESKNDFSDDSHYESFSTESKYDSFDDSLNVAKDGIPIEKNWNSKEINASHFLSEQVNVNCKRQLIDKKNIAGHFCDSLEDIHSLVSSGDKFSLSEEIEDINIMEISHTCDDSLRNDICVANRNSNSNEQCFDEDSLAILEYEKAFDDSLEDSNGPSISHIDSLILSKSKAHEIDSLVETEAAENKVAKNYFETPIEVIYENSKEAHADVKNMDFDKNSLSISECNLYRDSLEDLSELPNNYNTSKASTEKLPQVDKCINPSVMNSSKDFSVNEPELKLSKQIVDIDEFANVNKVTSRKTSTRFMKPLTELNALDIININETSCVDDSVLPSADSILDSSLGDINVKSIKSNFKAPLYEKESKLLLNPLDSNDTICIDDSILPSADSILDSSTVDINIKSINSNFKTSLDEKESNLPLNSIDSNNTICIDDSVISSSYTTACSVLTNDYYAPKSSISGDEFGSMEIDKAYLENAKLSNSNDTIWIEDSIMERSDEAISSNNFGLDCPNDKNVLENNILEFDSVTPTKALNVFNTNETICIDDSVILPLDSDLKKDKITPRKSKELNKNKRKSSSQSKHFEKDFQKLRVSDTEKAEHENIPSADFSSPVMPRNTMIDIVVRSPLHGCQRSSNVSKNSNLKEGNQTSEKGSMLIPGSRNEQNVKVHVEVKSEGVNLISVSSVEQGSSEEHCASSKKGVYMSGESKNSTSEFRNNHSNFDIVCDRLQSISADSQKKTSVSTKFDLHIGNFPYKKKIDQNRYSADFHAKFEMHDVSLLQALDLHDTSINISQSGPLQSRDSIMPLNLCVREKSFDRRNKPVMRNESKENIPFIPSKKFFSRELNIPKNQKLKGSPKKTKGTPLKNKIVKQQLNNNTEIKKSGGKINSTTKIPVRKIDNLPTSQKKQKLEFKPAYNSDKNIKRPFAVPACPSAPKEVSGDTPKKPHHFCMVRNSISKVPKSSQKNVSKKFQNIQSPIAKYIGTAPVHTPLKSTHRYDGNLLLASAEPLMANLKTPKPTGLTETPCSIKSDKKF